jgi:hypothetical protein
MQSYPNDMSSHAFDRILNPLDTTLNMSDSNIYENNLERYKLYLNMNQSYLMKDHLCLNSYRFYTKSPQMSASK